MMRMRRGSCRCELGVGVGFFEVQLGPVGWSGMEWDGMGKGWIE